MRRAHAAMALMLIVAAAGSACTVDEPKPTYDLGTFPYHPLVYELDLAILAYQVHAQSMVWPIDPYYEEHAGTLGTPRDTMMALAPPRVAARRHRTPIPSHRSPHLGTLGG